LDIKKANDLYEPALSLYPQLNDYAKDNWYFSGSGSSFFRINNVGLHAYQKSKYVTEIHNEAI